MSDREEEIKKIMESSGLPRIDAEFIYGIEHGEIKGDCIAVDPDKPEQDTEEDE